jgi:hypothetical protein
MRSQIEAYEARLEKTRAWQKQFAGKAILEPEKQVQVFQSVVFRRPTRSFLCPGSMGIGTISEASRRAAHGGNFERYPDLEL